ncbi:TCP-1/CPN60 chaperonin family protein (macronuclear) [Tetrahymena thermophila SB210]|uniref:TCP-1/CPN60 chaperonin family protein n=1 Tax=Tetrahymena thermophila (strain SB210) TaxID=312017 RepID=I7MEQ0_TETTS|nr:TCP-1/CPN60 chaperonin family protein [Tetrahymena thermophila SB210]EAR97343.3 TCP-1/CPN60 chaperonin family protein [Tetrahymena thermophila SB210]|eukprot:XP_001017588.3 TCP-1/CPN60 chaperonin family protein [Tetrahymena thermophila SB210]
MISKFAKSIYNYGTTSVIFGKNARDEIIKGIQTLNKATSSTLGPKGRNVCIENELRLPRITKDGVTVAKNVMFKSKLQEIGASLLRKASGSTNVHAGDGTTSTIIIAEAILRESSRFLEYKANPIEMKKGMDKARKHIVEFLNEISIPIETKDQLYKVAMVSTNYDSEMSSLISNALWEVGVDGLIEIEPGNQLKNELFFVNGATLNRGFASREFIVNKSQNKVEQSYPLILVANFPIQKIKEVVPALELAKKLNKPLFIIAEDISNEVISNLIFNQLKGIIECCAITVPGMGAFSKNILEDISLLTGAKLFDQNNYSEFINLKERDFGKCQKIQCSELETFFSGSYGDKNLIDKKIEELQMQMKDSSETSKKIYKDRLARLSGKMAKIMCGGNTEFDIFENRDRLVDGLNAVKNALKSGILPGGGICMIRASQLLDYVEVDNEEQQYGIDILKKALLQPTITLLENAGKNGRVVVEKIKELSLEDPYVGYDVNTDEYINLTERGIFDSLIVAKTTIEDSISVASMILTTEVAIIKDYTYEAPKYNTYRREIF